MRSGFYLLALLFIACLSACAGISPGAPTDESPLMEQVSATLGVPIHTFTPTPSSTPTRLVTPTVDYNAQIGQLQLDLQRSLGTATLAAVTAESISGTSTALQGYMNGTATATTALGNRRSTSTAAATQTLVAHAVETESAIQTATVQAPITQRMQAEADFEPARQIIMAVGIVLAILLGLWLGGQIGYQYIMLAYEKRLVLRGELAASQQANQVNARLDQRDKSGFGSVDFTTIPVGEHVLREVARLLTSGARYTQAQMTGSGRPLVKDSSFNTFGDWMVKHRIAEQLEDGRYSIIHPEFFQQVLERQ